jgi:hypothetical protein
MYAGGSLSPGALIESCLNAFCTRSIGMADGFINGKGCYLDKFDIKFLNKYEKKLKIEFFYGYVLLFID